MIKHTDSRINDNEGVSVKLYTHGSNAPHSHEFVELIYVLEGSGKHTIGNDTLEIESGDMFIIDIGVEHCYTVDEDKKLTLCNCLFYPEFLTHAIADNFIELAYDMFFGGSDESTGTKGYVALVGADTSEIRRHILEMVNEQEKKDEGYLKIIRSLLTAVIIKMFRLCAKTNPQPMPSIQRKIVGEIIDYVMSHDSKELSVSEISEAMFFSPSYIGRLFRKQTNKSLVGFIREKRVEKAAELLSNTTRSIEQIMADVGYSDKKYFYEQFYKFFGATPGEYRAGGGKSRKNE